MRQEFSSNQKPGVNRGITLKRHHKWLLGGFTSIVLIFMITVSIFVYMIYLKQELGYNELDKKISDLNLQTQSNINDLSSSLILTKNDITNLNSQLGDVNREFSSLKASVSEDFSEIIDSAIP